LIVTQHPAVEKRECKNKIDGDKAKLNQGIHKKRTYFVNYVGTNDSLPQWLHLEEFLGHLSFHTPVQEER